MSSRCPIREGSPLKNHTGEHGEASSMCPRRSRRTLDSVTSTPHLSDVTPRCFIRLYLPQIHSHSVPGPTLRAQKPPPRSGSKLPQLMLSAVVASPCLQL